MAYIKESIIDKQNSIANNGLSNISDVISNISELTSNPNLFYELEIAEVIDVINSKEHPDYKDNNIGFLKVRLLHSGFNEIDSIILCEPFHFGSSLTYPFKNELVLVSEINDPNLYNENIEAINYYWYTTFKFNNNLFQNLGINFSLKSIKQNENRNDEQLFNKYKKEDNNNKEFKLGDTIFSGRYNQVLKFTYNIDNYDPETVLQTKENILKQLFNPVDIKLISDITNSKYETKQFENQNVQLMESDNNIIQSKQRTIISSEKEINISSNKLLNLQSEKNIIIDSKKIYLGDDAKESAILGNQLKKVLEELIDQITSIKVIGNKGSPTSPPLNVAQIKIIKMKLQKILSKQVFVK